MSEIASNSNRHVRQIKLRLGRKRGGPIIATVYGAQYFYHNGNSALNKLIHIKLKKLFTFENLKYDDAERLKFIRLFYKIF